LVALDFIWELYAIIHQRRTGRNGCFSSFVLPLSDGFGGKCRKGKYEGEGVGDSARVSPHPKPHPHLHPHPYPHAQ